MKKVIWLTDLNSPCEAFLASDETPDVSAMVPCMANAQVQITFNSGFTGKHCHHHYITRTAFPDREIQGNRLRNPGLVEYLQS